MTMTGEAFSRTKRLLGEEAMEKLRAARVAVFGIGGVGGYVCEALARSGIGAFDLTDNDTVGESNLNRQLLSRIPLLGMSKARAAAEHIAKVNPDVTVEAVETFMTRQKVYDLIADCDIVLDALDNIPSRRMLAAACSDAGIPYVYGAIAGWVAQAGISMPGENLIAKLYPQEVEIRDKSVLSFTPALCASMQVSLCIKLLVGRPVETGRIYYFDLLNQEYEEIPFA